MKELKSQNDLSKGHISAKVNELQESLNSLSKFSKDMKRTKFFKYALNSD